MTSATKRLPGERGVMILGGTRTAVTHMVDTLHTPIPHTFTPGDDTRDEDRTFIQHWYYDRPVAIIRGGISEAMISPQILEPDYSFFERIVQELTGRDFEPIGPASPRPWGRVSSGHVHSSIGYEASFPISTHDIVLTPDSDVYDQGRSRFMEYEPRPIRIIAQGPALIDRTGMRLATQIPEPQKQSLLGDKWHRGTALYRVTNAADLAKLTAAWSQQHLIAAETDRMERHRKSLLAELEADFAAEPFEDGMDHEAEQILVRAFMSIEAKHLLTWLTDFSTDLSRPNLASSILRCLGRLNNPGTQGWRTQLISDALAKGTPEIRDAAVQAVEQWDESGLASVLKSHNEPLPWLQDYIRDVLQGMEG